MSYTTKLKMKPTSVIKTRLKIQPNGEVHKFFTETCAKHMDKYVPYDKGILAEYYIEDSDKIVYDQLYAEYQYYGERKDGSHVITNRTRIYHPLATSFWDKHMVTAEMPDVIKEVQEYIKRGGNK